MEWTEFARTHAQGICLETEQGHAEIETAHSTDHRVRVVVQRLTGTTYRKTFARDELAAAKAWAEAHLTA